MELDFLEGCRGAVKAGPGGPQCVCALLPPGRNFDKNGNMLDWWSNFSAQHFREESECMIYQYGNFSWDLADDQNVSMSPGLQWPCTFNPAPWDKRGLRPGCPRPILSLLCR